MKTIEEAAREYAKKKCLNDELHKSIFKSGFIVCAKQFANQWISIEEELPEADCFVLTKSKGNDDKDYYRVLWFRNLEFFTTEITSNITHWRPIELK